MPISLPFLPYLTRTQKQQYEQDNPPAPVVPDAPVVPVVTEDNQSPSTLARRVAEVESVAVVAEETAQNARTMARNARDAAKIMADEAKAMAATAKETADAAKATADASAAALAALPRRWDVSVQTNTQGVFSHDLTPYGLTRIPFVDVIYLGGQHTLDTLNTSTVAGRAFGLTGLLGLTLAAANKTVRLRIIENK